MSGVASHARQVLVADDSTVTRALLDDLLRDWGYEPLFAHDGEEAWSLLSVPGAPRLALVDWMMPRVDGLALCTRLRQCAELPYVYIILITSKNSDDDVVAALDAGADDFLNKPLQPDELRSRLAVGGRLLHYHDQLADRNEQLNTLFGAIPNALCFKDAAGRWLKANEAQLDLFNVTGDYVGRDDAELVRQAGARGEALTAFAASDEVAYELRGRHVEELTIATGLGQEKVFDFIKAPLFFPDGQRKGLLCIGHDVTDRKRLEERLRNEARYDGLTGLLTRRHLDQELHRAYGLAVRHQHPFVVCLCDIDHFKSVNDSHGHAHGDRVLAGYARIVREALRDEDIVGRYGGDEFCIGFPSTTAEEAAASLERIRRRIEQECFGDADGDCFPITGSFGVAALDSADTSLCSLLEQADRALYEAKSQGRNRLVVAAPDAR